MARVNPAQLVWARETAGLGREQAATLLKVASARGQSAVDRLAAIEAGEELSRTLLLQMAKVYRRPLLTFYMEAPPKPSDRGEDFRSVPEGEREVGKEAVLDALLRDVKARQTLVRGTIEEDDEAEPIAFVGSKSVSDGVAELVQAIQGSLGLGRDRLRRERTADSAFSLLRNAVEKVGVFVLLVGDLGSHHTALDVKTFRGFALADKIAPFIVINDKDARTAWSFTLLHELAHLWIGATGVSGGTAPNSPVERFCNEVASSFLVEKDELELLRVDIEREPRADVVMALLTSFADTRRVSPNMVAYRAFRQGILSATLWTDVEGLLRERFAAIKDREAAKPKSGAPDYYTVRRHRLGGLVSFTRRALQAGALTPSKAALVLGVKPRMVQTLVGAA